MKKSLLTLLTAILIGSSFTSCVENTIPDEVVAIYDGQASLLAAQAALLAAQANEADAAAALSAAMSAAEQARTAAQTIANAYEQANNTILLAAAQAALESQIAQDAANLADQEAALIARTAEHARVAALAQAQLDVMVATNATTAALAAEELAALIAQNDVDNSTAIANLEALIAQNAIDASNAEAALAATIAQNAIDAATAQEALANTIAQNALALEAAQAELANMASLNAVELATQEALLEALLAQAVIDAENAILALALAQAENAEAIAVLANKIADLDDDQLEEYFKNWGIYAALLNLEQVKEIDTQLDIIEKIAANALLVQTDAQAIAGFNNDLSIAQSAKADLEAGKAILEASIAAGTSIGDNTAKAALLQAEIDAINADLVDLGIEIAELEDVEEAQDAVVDAMNDELGLGDLEDDFQELKNDLANVLADKANEVAMNVVDSTNIANWTKIITDYDATTATLEGTVATTEAALEAAEAALEAAEAALEAAQEAAGDAQDDADDENEALDDLNFAKATAQVDVNAAAQAWQDAKEALEASTTQDDVDDAIIALASAQDAYDLARANFDDQSSDFTWGPGPDGEAGIQNPNSDDAVATYRAVTSVTETGTAPNEVYTATYSEATNLNITAGGNLMDPDDVDENTANGDWYEFGLDDLATNDLIEFQNATEALDDAKDDLEAANLANVDLEEAADDAEQEYIEAVTFYEGTEALVLAQEGVVEAAEAAAEAADDAVETAIEVQDDAVEAEDEANDEAIEAQAELGLHEGTTVADYESDIEDAEVAILQRDIMIAAIDITIPAIQAEIDIVLEKLNAGIPADLLTAMASLEALNIQLNDLNATKTIMENSRDSKAAIVLLIGAPSDAIQTEIDGMDAAIAEQDVLIATAEANIIAFPGLTEVERDAIAAQELANLVTALANIQSDIELYTALSAKYKDLVDSLL